MSRTPIIAVRDLTTKPGDDGAPILRGVSLAVEPGERIVLTGPSGSGKSTLLRCMVLLEHAEGRVLLDGEAVDAGRVRELRRRVGYLPQRPVAIDDRIAGNLAFAREAADDGVESLNEAGQLELLQRLGLDGLDRSRRFDGLSGGEQQRVALVRTLTVRPQVLLLDEPTASLDEDNVGAVVELLTEWVDESEDRALLWVSHQAREVESLASRQVALEELTR
ncbi:MAG: ABC transporter ATP-binding protein [Candidatus Longimicrobiales bacterium M2_2A_002]